MKIILAILTIILFAGLNNFGQDVLRKKMNLFADTKLSVQKMEEILGRAKWVEVTTDDSDSPVMVDAVDMFRLEDIVVFREKWEKRGTTNFLTLSGSCSTDRMSMINAFAIYASNPKKLVKLELGDDEPTEVKKGSIGYFLLDYVCEKAVVVNAL